LFHIGLDSLASLVSTISTVSSVETVRRNMKDMQPPTHENATSTRNSSPVPPEKNEGIAHPQVHPTENSGKDDACKNCTSDDKKHEEDRPSKTESIELASSCQTSRHLPEGHRGQHPNTFSSAPSAYSYMGMMPPPGGCTHAPQPFPISIHIHLPSFPMGIPSYQYGPQQSNVDLNVGASAASGIAPDFNSLGSNNCKCSHQPKS